MNKKHSSRVRRQRSYRHASKYSRGPVVHHMVRANHRRSGMSRVALVARFAVVTCSLFCSVYATAGLLTNSNFDTGTAPWATGFRETPENFSYHWNSFQDGDSPSSSGSLDTTNIGTHATLGLTQCV